jgi:phosphoribosylformylglycinamidine synthase
LDPEGKAIHHALVSLGYPGVASVRVGKVIDLELSADHAEAAIERGREMCRKLLANPVTEDFEITIGSQGNGEGGPR